MDLVRFVYSETVAKACHGFEIHQKVTHFKITGVD